MVVFNIEDVIGRFPGFRVGVVLAEGLRIRPERTPALDRAVRDAEAEVVATLGQVPLAEIPELKAWREAYKDFGVKKTSYRSSVERLIKRVQQGAGLPHVNTLVDAYNVVSVRYRMPVGADDLDQVAQPMGFRFARAGDTFVALGDESRSPDPPKPGEVVYADGEKVLCRRWNWYQDARSAVTEGTARAVLTMQAIEPASAMRVEEAVEQLCTLVAEHCGARTRWAMADRDHPAVHLAATDETDTAGVERTE